MKIFRNKLKNRKKVFIHIGFMKTGTSAIQSFINFNAPFLEKNDFFYPLTNIEAMNYLGFSLLDEIPPFIHHKLSIEKDALYKKLNEEIKNSKQKNIILTTEAFSLISTDYFLGEKAPERLFNLLKNDDYEFKIIAFVRRQDDYLETQYNQHVKTHNFWNLYDKDILSFYDEKKELLNFNKVLRGWAKVFGEENLVVKVYDKRKDSVLEFVDALGISEKSNIEKKLDINPKLSSKSLEFMRVANKYEIMKETSKQNSKLVELIEDVLGNLEESIPLLSDKEANTIMEHFQKDNLELSNKYFKGDITWCLPMKRKMEINEKQQNKLTAEESVQVATHIWNYFQKKDK